MQLAHVTSSISRTGAGVSKVVGDLAVAQAGNGLSVRIFTLADQFTYVDNQYHTGVTQIACPVSCLSRFGYSRNFRQTLSLHAGSINLIHMHGLWMYPNWIAGNIARMASIPCIMSPHGMLDPWGLKRSRWKKKIVGLLFEYANISFASCLHACSKQEASNFRDFGYKGPIALIPLGLTRCEFNKASYMAIEQCNDFPILSSLGNKKILLFLSRLHVKKGIEVLLATWKYISKEFMDWHLVIVGDGESAYVCDLEYMVNASGVANSVTFIGPVHGNKKWIFYQKANLFILPTYNENFGFVIVEALASGTPVITTKETPWNDLEKEKCGWWIDVGEQQLKECLLGALSTPVNKLKKMGERGRELVQKKYAIDRMANEMDSVYRWILQGGLIPDCVMLD